MKENFPDAIDLCLLDALQTDASRSNLELARHCKVSPATALRRVQALRASGLIERQVALLQPERLAEALGHGLTALVEISLDRQGAEHLDAFERFVLPHPEVQQCYRVSPGPDFVLVLAVRNMADYQACAQRLFTQQANVRNVKAFFCVKRAKFEPAAPLPVPATPPRRPTSA